MGAPDLSSPVGPASYEPAQPPSGGIGFPGVPARTLQTKPPALWPSARACSGHAAPQRQLLP
eukprot:9550422-Alexandrium_andersonii.AAC.1